MPLTFPSHAAAVLPLKLGRRRWFDGVALVIGSAAPDFPYSLAPYLTIRAHTWTGLVVFCVPATVVLAVLTRAAAPAVVAHLPTNRLTRPFAVPDYAVLATRRHPFVVTLASAWLGAASHRLWDMVTHPPSADLDTLGLAALDRVAFAGQPWWWILHHGSTLIGAVAVLLMALHIGRTRWLVADGATPPPVPVRPVLFWTTAATIWVPGLAAQPFLAWFSEPPVVIVRLMELGCLGLLAGAGAVYLGGTAQPGQYDRSRAWSTKGRSRRDERAIRQAGSTATDPERPAGR